MSRKKVIRSQANQFELYAIECLKRCYDYDEEKTCEIAVRRIYLFWWCFMPSSKI